MVSLVLVSHSRALAEAVIALVRQVTPPAVNIAIAAGVGDDRLDFGTDAVAICEAIQSVDDPSGVLVLMDLGSAILSAETALELLPDDLRPRVRLCPAPLVEGSISAAVQSSLGSHIDAVYDAATEALQPKEEHLTAVAIDEKKQITHPQVEGQNLTAPVSATVRLINQHGLHARPAARIVQTAAGFDADIEVQKVGSLTQAAPARSLNKLATLGVEQNDQITFIARGRDAAAAVIVLRQLVESGFGEDVSPLAKATQPDDHRDAKAHNRAGTLVALPVSQGIAVGTLQRFHPSAYLGQISASLSDDPDDEWQRLERAIAQVRTNIENMRKTATIRAGDQQASIFDAHLLMLEDAELVDRARRSIVADHDNAAHAWSQAIENTAASYRGSPDVYIQQRGIDILDLGAQVIAILDDKTPEPAGMFLQPCILMSDDFSPRQIAELDASKVLGLIASAGSANSHASILARAVGIPAVAGAGSGLENVPDGAVVAIDGSTGDIWLNPSREETSILVRRRSEWRKKQQLLVNDNQGLTTTSDGRRIEIAANLSGLVDARVALAQGAESVGVLRTEFLYLTRNSAPSEAEQVSTLRQISELMQGRPVIVRTLDVGGDKPISYMPLAAEANPYLGVRAIRLSLQKPELFTTQIRAILRSALDCELRILLPMITLVEELQQARDLIEQAHHALQHEGVPHRWPVPVGIMVETPAAALLAMKLAPYTDFFSIGTNDLTQYTLAAERGNPHLQQLSDALHPSVLRLIQEVVAVAHQNGKWVAVCGEIAADPVAAPVLVGLGVDELSMNVAAIPQVKAIVRQLKMPALETLVQQALQAASAGEVRHLSQQTSVV